MNIALYLPHKLLLGMQRLLFGSRPPKLAMPPYIDSRMPANEQAARRALTLGNGSVHSRTVAKKVMPLRVLRVVESGQPRTCTGRLVMSGRMADVCAELDRLVEREAALH